MKMAHIFACLSLLIFSLNTYASSVTRETISGAALKFDGDRDYVM